MAPQTLRQRLTPDLLEADPLDVELAMFPLQVSFVRTKILSAPRFHSRVLEELLSEWGLDLTTQYEPFEKEQQLCSTLRLEFNDMFVGLGLAWNANGVVGEAVAKTAKSPVSLGQFSRENINIALRLRKLANQTCEGLPAPTQLSKDGLLCFAAWTADIPTIIVELLSYRLDTFGFQMPSTEASGVEERQKMSALCDEWIATKTAFLPGEEEDLE
jgi:hypothetical protein